MDERTPDKLQVLVTGVDAAGIIADPRLRGTLVEALRQFAQAIHSCAEPVA